MKRYLKDFKLDVPFIEDAIYECLNSRGNSKKRWKRLDVAYFLSDYLISFGRNRGLNRQDLAHYIHDYITTHDDFKKAFTNLIYDIAVSIFNEIDTQSITLDPIKYIDKVDVSSGKVRKIGLATIKQQVYDYIVVKACNQMFLNKIGTYQCASIKGRGQIYGKKAIEKWIRKNPKSCKWIWKGDVKKFYPSVPHDKLKELLRRDIKNDTVIYILFTLINTYDTGLCIGSYLSKSLANYYLSYAYHYLSEQCFKIRHKRDGTVKRVRLISHLLFYMDDVVIFSSSKKDLKLCIKSLNNYLCTQLGLRIKSNEQLFILDSRPIDMMGYRIYTGKTTIRKRIFKRANKVICRYRSPETVMSAKDAKSIMAYKGYFDNSDSIKYKRKHKCERIFEHARKVIKKMRTKALFTEKQPQYRYFKVNDVRADIFIYNYLKDALDEETGSTLYEHEFNQFTINPSDITEDMIKKNPMSYMDYIAPVEKSDAEKLADTENSITELQLALVELCESVGAQK